MTAADPYEWVLPVRDLLAVDIPGLPDALAPDADRPQAWTLLVPWPDRHDAVALLAAARTHGHPVTGVHRTCARVGFTRQDAPCILTVELDPEPVHVHQAAAAALLALDTAIATDALGDPTFPTHRWDGLGQVVDAYSRDDISHLASWLTHDADTRLHAGLYAASPPPAEPAADVLAALISDHLTGAHPGGTWPDPRLSIDVVLDDPRMLAIARALAEQRPAP